MKKRNIILASIATIAIIATGCSGGGDGTATTVTVERGPVYNSIVTDSSTPPKTATATANSNKYVFASAPKYPIMANGGQVDVYSDGKLDAGIDVNLQIPLAAEKGNIITSFTTYFNDLNDSQEEAFAATNGFTVADLTKLPSESTGLIASAMNAIYVALVLKDDPANTNTIDENYILAEAALASVEGSNDNNTVASPTTLGELENAINDFLNLDKLTDTEIEVVNSQNNDNTTSDNTTSDNTTSDNITG